MRLIQVKEFNREGEARYEEAVKAWEFSKGGFPCRAMYLYTDEETGRPKRKGWVLIWEGTSMLFRNRERALFFAKGNGII